MVDARDHLEPAAIVWTADGVKLQENPPGEHDIHLSIAISLKRIADAITGVGENAFTQALNHYGENIGECIQGQFERSQR